VVDRNRASPKRRIVALFHRRIEGVHVDVDDLAHRHALTLSRWKQKENSGVSTRRVGEVFSALSGDGPRLTRIQEATTKSVCGAV
jgi:hypothetical protein